MLKNGTLKNNDFFYGCGSGLIETIILYPANKVVFRQALHGFRSLDAFSQLKNEGIFLLYRGLLPPLIMRTSTRSLMFGTNDAYKKLLGCDIITGNPDNTLSICHSTAAFLAGVTEAILCPLERVQVLLQHSHYHREFKNTKEAFKELRKYGLKEYYRGLSVIVLRNGLSNALFFTLRKPLKNHLISENNITNRPFYNSFADFVSGGLLGATISTIFFPMNVVKTRMQSVVGIEYLSGLQTLKLVWKERDRNFQKLFRGVHLNFLKSLFSWGLTNSIYELLRNTFE
uniref:Mitochondrial carrier triple repeat protein 1 n=1 Tax=Strongyloides stercoralis TaxID=6248 RepID=A0A0K0E0X9_STRER